MSDSSVLQPHSCKQYHDSVADREDGGQGEERGRRVTHTVCVKPSWSNAHMHILLLTGSNLRIQKKKKA